MASRYIQFRRLTHSTCTLTRVCVCVCTHLPSPPIAHTHVQVIKLYAWEIPFQRLIMGIRNKELDVLKASAYLNAGSAFTWTCAPFLVSKGEAMGLGKKREYLITTVVQPPFCHSVILSVGANILLSTRGNSRSIEVCWSHDMCSTVCRFPW